jgi:hypothetical protein
MFIGESGNARRLHNNHRAGELDSSHGVFFRLKKSAVKPNFADLFIAWSHACARRQSQQN